MVGGKNESNFLKIIYLKKIIYLLFLLYWVIVATHEYSLCQTEAGYSLAVMHKLLIVVGGFSLLQSTDSRVSRLQ